MWKISHKIFLELVHRITCRYVHVIFHVIKITDIHVCSASKQWLVAPAAIAMNNQSCNSDCSGDLSSIKQ